MTFIYLLSLTIFILFINKLLIKKKMLISETGDIHQKFASKSKVPLTGGFFIFLGISHLLIGLFGMYRITRREYEDNPDSTFTPLPRNITPLGIELDPTTAADLSNSDKK